VFALFTTTANHRYLKLLAIFAGLILLPACGYSLRTSQFQSRLSRDGISRIYIHPIANDTFRPGIENVVFNAVMRSMGGTTGVRATSNLAQADAELFGTVTRVDRPVSGQTKASDLSPKNLGSSSILVAVEYQAVLDCSFILKRRPRAELASAEIWKGSFSRSKPFPGNNQIWSLGSTSALINDSELDRSLTDIAEQMGRDVVQSMLETF